jgi:hypothetical protein
MKKSLKDQKKLNKIEMLKKKNLKYPTKEKEKEKEKCCFHRKF